MDKGDACRCGEAPKMMFACSGGSDVGEIADRTARRLFAGGAGKIYCLSGICGYVAGILKTTESAGLALVIDGCPVDCGKKTLEHAGLSGFIHLQVTDPGMEKGKSPATDERISRAVEKVGALLVK